MKSLFLGSLISIAFFSFSLGSAKSTTTLVLTDEMVATVPISYRGAILNFPSKPKKVIIGTQGAFVVDYIGNDVVISPLATSARSNIFIYLDGRRFNLDVVAKDGGHTIVQIKDKVSRPVEVQYESK